MFPSLHGLHSGRIPSLSRCFKHLLLYVVVGLLCGAITVSGLHLLFTGSVRSAGPITGYLALVLLSASTAAATAGLLVHAWHGRLWPDEAADCTLLLLSVAFPTLLALLRFHPLPTSDDAKVNCLVTFAFLLRLGALMDFPPKHSMIQFLLSFPTFTLLDFHRRCNQPRAYPELCQHLQRAGLDLIASFQQQQPRGVHCCSTSSLGHHLVSRGLVMLGLGLVAVSVPIIMALKQEKACREPQHEAQEDNPRDYVSSHESKASEAAADVGFDPWPLGAFGERLLHRMGLAPLLVQAETLLHRVSDHVDEAFLVGTVCLPIGLYYSSFALMMRLMPKWMSAAHVTSDEWLLALSVFFVLGRQSCKVELMPTLTMVQNRLVRSQIVLGDVLPSHVVSQLLERESSHARLQRDQSQSHLLVPESPCGVTPPADEEVLLAAAQGGEGAPVDPPSPSCRASCPADFGWRTAPTHGNSSSALPLYGSLLSASSCLVGSDVSKFSVAECHDCVSIFFSDICDFSEFAHELPAAKVMDTLNALYSRLDDVIIKEMPELYKVETIGSVYLVAANLTSHDPHHAATILRFALRAQEEASKVPRPDKDDGSSLQLRIGIHSGPIVSGAIGKVRRHFCLFGDSVNMAARTESTCPPGCIQITAWTHQLALQQAPRDLVFKDWGEVLVKGAPEPLHMYLVMSRQIMEQARALAAAGLSRSLDV